MEEITQEEQFLYDGQTLSHFVSDYTGNLDLFYTRYLERDYDQVEQEMIKAEKGVKELSALYNSLFKIDIKTIDRDNYRIDLGDSEKERVPLEYLPLISFTEEWLSDFYDDNTGASPGCDCGCGGDTHDFEGSSNRLERSNEVLEKFLKDGKVMRTIREV